MKLLETRIGYPICRLQGSSHVSPFVIFCKILKINFMDHNVKHLLCAFKTNHNDLNLRTNPIILIIMLHKYHCKIDKKFHIRKL